MARSPRKEIGVCDVPDELRCKRTDSKRWRCPEPHVVGRGYCQYHLDKIREGYFKRKNKKASNDNTDTGAVQPMSHEVGMRERDRSNTPEENPHVAELAGPIENLVNRLHSADALQEIGVTQRSCDLRNPQIAQIITVPTAVLNPKDLSEILSMDAWNECLSPAERYNLRSFLHKGDKSDAVVESLLTGQILRFGRNPTKEWWNSACSSELHPEALLQNEEKLKVFQSQFYKNIKTLNDTFISQTEELKKLCLLNCHCDEKEFRKQLKELRKKKTKSLKKLKNTDPKW